MVVWTIAVDLIQDVRGTIAMYMFIVEEAIQAVSMACYLLQKAGMTEEAKEKASWAIDNLINPALQFAKTYGHLAYPLEIAYESFYNASLKTMQTYFKL